MEFNDGGMGEESVAECFFSMTYGAGRMSKKSTKRRVHALLFLIIDMTRSRR